MEIYHTVNSGIYALGKGHAILIDGIHRGEKVGFSPMPQIYGKGMEGVFRKPDLYLFTHAHPDHFDEDILLAEQTAKKVYGPGFGEVPARTVSANITQVLVDYAEIFALKTIHAGRAFSEEPHYSYYVEMEGRRIFISGDARLRQDEARLLDLICDRRIDAVFVNPMQLLEPESIAFLRELNVKKVFLYHLPLVGDDRLGCFALAREAGKRYPQDLPELERVLPMSRVDLD